MKHFRNFRSLLPILCLLLAFQGSGLLRLHACTEGTIHFEVAGDSCHHHGSDTLPELHHSCESPVEILSDLLPGPDRETGNIACQDQIVPILSTVFVPESVFEEGDPASDFLLHWNTVRLIV